MKELFDRLWIMPAEEFLFDVVIAAMTIWIVIAGVFILVHKTNSFGENVNAAKKKDSN